MAWALDLKEELISIAEAWQRESLEDYPAHRMISNLDIPDLWVNSDDSPETIADKIAGYAEGRPGSADKMLDRIARSKEPEGEGDDLTLEMLLVEYLSLDEWN